MSNAETRKGRDVTVKVRLTRKQFFTFWRGVESTWTVTEDSHVYRTFKKAVQACIDAHKAQLKRERER